MKHTNSSMPDNLVFLNYKQSANKNIPAASDIPIGNQKIFDTLKKNDSNPMLKVEAIDYPAVGTGGVYEKSFFKSFVDVTKNRPIPGSKRGHEYASRPANDFYMIGGQLIDNADGKTGTAIFLMYIPPFGDSTDNTGFMRDADAGIVNFSLVTQPEYNVKKDDDGIERRHFTKTNGYERNDAVEYGAGAMAQVVNSNTSKLNFELTKALAMNGQYVRENKDGEIIQSGKVSYPVLRSMVAHADCENKSEIAEILSIIDKKTNGGKPVELKEAMEMVVNALKNGAVAFAEIAKNAGCEKLLKTDTDTASIALANSLSSKLGAEPEKALDLMIKQNADNSKAIVENSIVAVFGTKEKDIAGVKKENAAFTYAFQKLENKKGEELVTALNSLKEDPIMKAIRQNQADNFSETNTIENGGTKQATKTAETVSTY